MSIICHADISKSASFHLQHNITIFKDGKLVYMIVSDKGIARYEVPIARSSDTGEYECTVKADGKTKSSNLLQVWVTGEYSFKHVSFLRYKKKPLRVSDNSQC